MATLKAECKIFIVQSIACYETPSQVVESVREKFGIEITRQQVESHDPTKVSSKGLAQKWIDIFNATRERFRKETSDIPIANKAYRLRVLNRMAVSAESMKNYGMTADILEQAAKEVGGKYTSRLNVEHTGKNSGTTQAQSTGFNPQEAVDTYKKMMK
ncbi:MULTISPECIES: DUF2280 domain-containing protein [Klebsiella]|uniref:DUF2280 domain-containing protein n=1 Tax=Klebsiella michiganensis TaxID=1134687 RepID=A0AB35Q530_9ENTR|nr:DUF2280 domain-containing protein [Klebsiella michiganensis]MBD0922041.1 DUF2280 domain-containing protein [Klebsiella michiganensis]MBD0959865.1 DUF2280 domain-containing protein [Klebsiella michiganensis]MBG2589743.1 DUF2280 domain-containing protein [Klebsiella michiganensis]MBG2640211.1 DUF2280 domain-containing protein [Klebsiella michiganensis]MBG2680884.1 DUF2280 domain-containing protein [Klebsiella michiganensis]